MKLRKLIPTILVVMLSIILSVSLFIHGVPKALAAEEKTKEQVWEQSESGFVYGLDWTLYPYTYTMYVEDKFWSYDSSGNLYLDPESPDHLRAAIFVDLDSEGDSVVGNGTQCVMEVELYIPGLDRYETRTVAGKTAAFVSMSAAENGVVYPGEVVRATAWFFIMDRHVGTLQWYPEAE